MSLELNTSSPLGRLLSDIPGCFSGNRRDQEGLISPEQPVGHQGEPHRCSSESAKRLNPPPKRHFPEFLRRAHNSESVSQALGARSLPTVKPTNSVSCHLIRSRHGPIAPR